MKIVLAAILLVAAALKAANHVYLVNSGGLLADPILLFGTIFVESCVAVCMLFSSPRIAWRLATVTFVPLLSIALYTHATGESCNCFGQTESNSVVLWIDVAVVLTCILIRPVSNNKKLTRATLVAAAATGGFLCIATLLGDNLKSDAKIDMISTSDIGDAWPIGNEFGEELEELVSGRWLVLIVRTDCAHCRQLIAKQFSSPNTPRQNERTAVFVVQDGRWYFWIDKVTISTLGAPSIYWQYNEPFVASPAVFLLEEGTIIDAATGKDAHEFVGNLFLPDV